MASARVPEMVPPLCCSILSHVSAAWPEIAEVLSAARALSHRSRLPNALSIEVNEVRVAMASALLCTEEQATVAQGTPLAWALAREAFAHLGRGQFSNDDKSFYPENPVLGPVADRITR